MTHACTLMYSVPTDNGYQGWLRADDHSALCIDDAADKLAILGIAGCKNEGE